jgi:membrane-bound lytic murein transglycosylase A
MASGKNYARPLPQGQLALRKLDARDVPDFTPACENMGSDLSVSIANSLDYLAKPSSRQFFPYGEITHDQAVATLLAMQDLANRKLPPPEANRMLREQFDTYISVGCDDAGTVLYTGYYTPIFDASPVRTDRFRYPLYKMPADLVKNPQTGETIGQRKSDGSIVQYPDRKTIESGNMLAGNELIYLADPFEVYIAHVQGSAKLRLSDGTLQTVGYAANNGYAYQSVARALIDDKRLPAEQLSLKSMIDYFHAHPAEVATYTARNPRFVFFQVIQGNPRGCLNEPVTNWRSIATDKGIFPRACMGFLQTRLYRDTGAGIIKLPYSGFALDQDAGGAIRAPGRCDVYMGVGDRAGELAGRTQEEGKLYYLFLKPQYVQQQLRGGAATAAPLAPPAGLPAAPSPVR